MSILIQDVVNVLDDYFGLVVSEKFVEDLLNQSPELLEEIDETSVSDTLIREIIIDEAVNFLTNSEISEWPNSGDDLTQKEVDEVQAKIQKAHDAKY